MVTQSLRKLVRAAVSLCIIAIAIGSLFSAMHCRADVTIAADIASNNPYDNGWQNLDNGGFGFGAWSLTGGGTHGFFIGDSTSVGTPGADINTAGESFGIYTDNNGGNEFANAIRSFTTLSVGQTFSIDLAVNFRNGSKGMDLRNSGGSTIFNFDVSNDDYSVNGSSIGNAYSGNTEFSIAFTQTALTSGTWTLTRSAELAT